MTIEYKNPNIDHLAIPQLETVKFDGDASVDEIVREAEAVLLMGEKIVALSGWEMPEEVREMIAHRAEVRQEAVADDPLESRLMHARDPEGIVSAGTVLAENLPNNDERLVLVPDVYKKPNGLTVATLHPEGSSTLSNVNLRIVHNMVDTGALTPVERVDL